MADNKVLDIENAFKSAESMAEEISYKYSSWNNGRQQWKNEKVELRQYLFATDTSETSNSTLPWRNTVTIPKLTQIRDNLHANYDMALFPNDDWLQWEAYSADSVDKNKRDAITAYMENKLRESDFRITMSQCLLDYIDYGFACGTVDWIKENKEDPSTGEKIDTYTGPRAIRVSPLDIVFDITAASFKRTPKIRRIVKQIGQLKKEIDMDSDNPNTKWKMEALTKALEFRSSLSHYDAADIEKAAGYLVDGFTSITDYYRSGLVELLEFEGDIFDPKTGELHQDQIITIMDRMYVVREETQPSWIEATTYHGVPWRRRPDNLMGMGPLDNLVGMQYRIDHLENLKNDAMDLAVFPPLVIQGNVEAFVYGPGEEIDVGDDGNVTELGRNLNGVITAENNIQSLENKMEEMAGAPKQALGMRTPGEKTAFEVQSLENAASRIFQHKITQFEIEFLEPLLNLMLETARRNLDGKDTIRVLDNDLAVMDFISITREDLTAKGKLRPVGARHFAAKAKLVQELSTLFNTKMGDMVAPHTSGKKLSALIENSLHMQRHAIFTPNIGIAEQKETQQMVNAATSQLEEEAATPAPQVEGEEQLGEI